MLFVCPNQDRIQLQTVYRSILGGGRGATIIRIVADTKNIDAHVIV